MDAIEFTSEKGIELTFDSGPQLCSRCKSVLPEIIFDPDWICDLGHLAGWCRMCTTLVLSEYLKQIDKNLKVPIIKF